MIFVNSMSDLFHELVDEAFIASMWEVMAMAPQHTFQVLTKRPERMPEIVGRQVARHGVLPNVWLGTSIETNRWVQRADWLRRTPAVVRFISAEPLLGPLDDLDLKDLDWLIAGGESNGPPRRALVSPPNGHGPEPKQMALEWVRSLRDRCGQAGVAFFFKQWGGRTPRSGGRILDGRTWDEMPQPLSATTRIEAPSTLATSPS